MKIAVNKYLVIGALVSCAMSAVLLAPAAEPATMPAATAPSPKEFKLDEHGYIRNWLVLAPIAFGDGYNADDIVKEQIKGEADLTPAAGDKQKVTSQEGEAGSTKPVEKTLTWKALATDDYFFDLNVFTGLDTTDGMGGYAVAYLDCPAEMKDITFSLCSNDDGLIYLNGKKVYSFVGGRALSEDADTVEGLTLKKGVNVIIFKDWNDAGNWQGCIRLLTKDGKPVTGVTVKLTK